MVFLIPEGTKMAIIANNYKSLSMRVNYYVFFEK